LFGKKTFSDKTIEAANNMGLDMLAINEILNSTDLARIVLRKFNADYTIRSLIRLNNGIWLDDEIININISRIKEKANKGIHIFNSFFIEKLYRETNVYAYCNVKRLS
jgi:Ulp1 family protease